MAHQILLYYKYVKIKKPEEVVLWQKSLCEEFNLKGRIIVAEEGINGTVEGTIEDTEKYIAETTKDPRFIDINFKKSGGTGNAFPKLSVKARKEIVSGHLKNEDLNPNELTGKYLSADELHQLYENDEEFFVIDMRNDYEYKSGHFKNSILPLLSNFRDLPKIVSEIENLKNKKIVTVCTGGVRCEKASGYLIEQGFKDVSQLKDGIVTYMEKFPNQYFKGKLYVFDQRVLMGFDTDSPEHEIVGKCFRCQSQSENYINCANNQCHKHIICCSECIEKNGAFCQDDCAVSLKK